jgi:glycosyltransferase involved in cell wall biosynthesis
MSQPKSLSEASDVSVVIATLGGDCLAGTIEKLNAGTVVPAEILICIPEIEAPRADKFAGGNVRVVRTPCRGQVAQRAWGFGQARHDFVLQLDDDIHVHSECIERLRDCVSRFSDVAAGPRMHDLTTGEYTSFLVPAGHGNRFLERLMFWVINGKSGYEPGRIGRAGICMGLPEEPAEWLDIDWLPGGCVLHRRANLVLANFYPFRGKAFAEDLFHSVELTRKGVRLARWGSAGCHVDFRSAGVSGPLQFAKLYFRYARALTRLVEEIRGSKACLYAFLFLNIIRIAPRTRAAQRRGS